MIAPARTGRASRMHPSINTLARGLASYTYETHEAERDPLAWPILVDAIKVDERDHAKLPFLFARRCIVIPMFALAELLPEKRSDKANEFIDTFTVDWLNKQKPKPARAGRPQSKIMDMLVVAAACQHNPKEGDLSERKYYARIAQRFGAGLNWRQAKHLHHQFISKRASASCEVCRAATDEVLRQIAGIMRSLEARWREDARAQRCEARFRRSMDVDVASAMAAQRALSKMRGEEC